MVVRGSAIPPVYLYLLEPVISGITCGKYGKIGLLTTFRPQFPKTSPSQSCSHRNSVQNAPIESSTALTATLFVNISLFMSLGNFWETSGRPSGNLWDVRNDFETLAQKTRFLKTGKQ